MSITLLSTLVIPSVFIAALTWLLQKIICEPGNNLKIKIREVDEKLDFLVNHISWTDKNYYISKSEINSIGKLSAEMKSMKSLSSCRLANPVIRCLFGLPSCNDLKKACDKLNDLANLLRNVELLQQERKVFPIIEEAAKEFQRNRKNSDTKEIERLIPEIRKILKLI